MFARMSQDASPVKLSFGGVDDMSDVSAIKTLAPGDEEFGSQELLRCEQPRRHAEDRCRVRMLDPRSIYGNCGVAHAGNQVYKIPVTMRFCQPHRITYLTLETMCRQATERGSDIFGRKEDIEILGFAEDSGMLLQRQCATNCDRNFLFLE